MNMCAQYELQMNVQKTSPTTQLWPLNTVRMQNLAKGKCMLSATSVSQKTRLEVQTQQAELPIGLSN